jgi:crotonobetainyl-CoA:carnitine CoA-transferase CaiB-like acyl-CoA transferase
MATANNSAKNTRGCLDGIRILELARYQAGPRCGMVLSDMGAEVIKLEKLGGEDTRKSRPVVKGQSIYFTVYNRGKKSMCLDLRKDAGKAVFFELLKTADMVLENFRPGTLEKMGLDYDNLIRVKPDIILIRVSGFGQYGPYKERAAFDPLGQAMSGLMMLTGAQTTGGPVGTAFSLIDRISSLHAAIGALGALHHRRETGQGQVIDVCLMDSAMTTVEIPASYYLATGKEGGEQGRQPYQAKDGFIVVSPGSSPQLRKRVYEMMGVEDKGDVQPAGGSLFFRMPALADWIRERSVEEAYGKLVAIGVPAAPIRTVPQAVKDPHVWERENLVKVEDALAGELYVPGLSIKFSKTPGRLGPVPTPGQHTDEILSRLPNFDSARIAQLRAQKVI